GHSRRRFLIGAGGATLFATPLAAAACGASGAAGTSEGSATLAGPATVEFWFHWGANRGQDKVNDAFHAQVPEVTIKTTPNGDSLDKLVAAVAAGTSPDGVTLSGSSLIQSARRGLIQPLDLRVAKSKIAPREKFYPAQLETYTWNGKLYGVPAWENGPGPFLFWNKDHLREQGFAPDRPPANLAE